MPFSIKEVPFEVASFILTANHFHYSLIIYTQVTLLRCKNAMAIIFLQSKLNTLSLSGHETETAGREDSNTMDLAQTAEAEQTARNSPSVSEVRANLAFFPPDSSLLVSVQRKRVNSFTDALACLLHLFVQCAQLLVRKHYTPKE